MRAEKKAHREWHQKTGWAWGLWRHWVRRREVAADHDIAEATKEHDDG